MAVMGTFDAVMLPEGSVRYAGAVRGMDEAGHDVFAVNLGGRDWIGEVGNAFYADGNTYDVLIVSFGHAQAETVDVPSGMRPLPRADLKTARRLIVGWVGAVMQTPNDRKRPTPFYSGRYSGRVVFPDGWARAIR